MTDFVGFYDLGGVPSATTAAAWVRLLASAGMQAAHDPTVRLRTAVAPSGREKPGAPASLSLTQSDLTLTLLGRAPHRPFTGRATDPDPASRLRALGGSKRWAAEAMLADLAGIWTALVMDHKEGTFTCTRSGEDAPPLAWFVKDQVVWFGSRLPVLRRMPQFPTGVDHSALSFLLAYGLSPSGRPLFRGVQQLGASQSLELSASGISVRDLACPAPSLPPDNPDGTESAVREMVRDAVRPLVSGRRVMLVGHQDPRTAWLAKTLVDAGASDIVTSDRSDALPTFDEALALAQRSIAAEGEVFAGPAGLDLLSRTHSAAPAVDVCVVPLGSTTLLPNALRHRRLSERLATVGGHVRRTPGASQFLQTEIGFVRDLYFEEIALCNDLNRTELSGPLLAQWGAFAMADELGPGLEGATADTAAARARDLDGAFLVPGLRRLAAGVARTENIPLLAPFLAASVQKFAGTMTLEQRLELGRHLADWPAEEHPTFATLDRVVASGEHTIRGLLASPTFISRGLFGRAAVNDLIEQHFGQGRHRGALIWALCIIELWFRHFVDYRR